MAGITYEEKKAYVEGFQACLNMIDEDYDGTNGDSVIQMVSVYLTSQLHLWAEGTIEYPPALATREIKS